MLAVCLLQILSFSVGSCGDEGVLALDTLLLVLESLLHPLHNVTNNDSSYNWSILTFGLRSAKLWTVSKFRVCDCEQYFGSRASVLHTREP
jgi:hypothetical protein